MKAFVTGSTGLLGNNLIRLLRQQGHEVKALVRSPEKARKLLPEDVEIVTGDMENVDAFKSALAGSDVLFHTAAYFREYYGPGDHWGTLERINVRGTINILEAAEKAGVKKVIYVSSSGVIGARRDGKPSDETTPPDAPVMQNLYFRSKVLAEQAIAEFQKTHALPIIQILPTAMFGPGDAAPTGAGQLVLDFVTRKLAAIPPGGFNSVDVRDVAQAMVNAVERGKNGERYIINNRFYTIAEMANLLTKMTSVPAPQMRLSYPMALAYAYFSEARARLTNTQTLVTVNAIRTLNMRFDVSAAKAIRELGITIRPFEETLRDEVNWFAANGYTPSGFRQVFVTA